MDRPGCEKIDHKNIVTYVYEENSEYPDHEDRYSPSERYPEYDGTVSSKNNHVYDMIRTGFFRMGLDRENYGTDSWNPLKDIITKGDSVLLKPNWVIDHNKEPVSHDMDCLVTHPSVLRAVLDYVVKALDGTGRIVVGDAPIQRCRLGELHDKMHYGTVWDHFKRIGVRIEVLDFRDVVADYLNRIEVERNEGIQVNMGAVSAFDGLDPERMKKMRITNYPTFMMQEHHCPGKHEYYVHPEVLGADVIINLPKPKTHRMAGLTGCAKNFIGINCRKECLPHHTTGSPESGGDEYYKANRLHDISSRFMDIYNNKSYSGSKGSMIYLLISKFFFNAGRMTGGKFENGHWYANDTIWRTIHDLNNIVEFADKNGTMTDTRQRKVLHICDMIVSGEKEGPLKPSPKHIGMIVMGSDAFISDYFVSKVFGFDPKKMKFLSASARVDDPSAVIVSDKDGNVLNADDVKYLPKWHLEPTSGWKGHLESRTDRPEPGSEQ